MRPIITGSSVTWFVVRVISWTVILVAAVLLVPRCPAAAQQSPSTPFRTVATFRGVGAPVNALIGPGPVPGGERYYVSYGYTGNVADVVAVDPDSGEYQVFTSPDPNV